jgi:hypothetical protein
VRPNALHLLVVLSERRASPLHDQIVGAGDFQRGVNERTTLDAIFEIPPPFNRGAMIEGDADDDGEVGDEMLLRSGTRGAYTGASRQAVSS